MLGRECFCSVISSGNYLNVQTILIVCADWYLSLTESQKAKAGGLAYEVILKPAAGDLPRPASPPKDKGLTHDDILRKLQEAEERRLVRDLNAEVSNRML